MWMGCSVGRPILSHPLCLFLATFLCLSIVLISAVRSEQVYDLVVAIPTVPRHRLLDSETPYLLTSLAKWNETVTEGDNLSIRIVIVSHEEGDETFEGSQRTYGDRFTFLTHEQVIAEVEQDDEECMLPVVSEEHAATTRPVLKHVQKQAMDLARTLRAVSRRFPRDKYLVLIEDDFVPCDGFPQLMRSLLGEATERYPDWFSIRISYGFTGLVLHNGRDVLRVADYIARHRARRPPDHLLVEFFAGETEEARHYKQSRLHLAYRLNILEHIGRASTLRVKRDASPHVDCLAPLTYPIVFHVETCADFNGQDICAPGLAQNIDAKEDALQNH